MCAPSNGRYFLLIRSEGILHVQNIKSADVFNRKNQMNNPSSTLEQFPLCSHRDQQDRLVSRF